ncbi:MAG TPA: SRPBCC domain-containing protein [Bacillales bacterium]|nr:SRPBCC domain-containing protein [Bacillales bacterium]
MIKKDSVKREIVIEAPVEKVWKALTVPEELNRWYTEECEIDFRVGGHVKMVHGWGAWSSGTITEIVEHEKFVFQTGDDAWTIITLTPADKGIKVSVEYKMPFVGDEGMGMSENMAFGTYQFLRNVKSVLENGVDLRPTLWPTWIGAFNTAIRPDHDEQYGTTYGTLVLNVSDDSPAKDSGMLPGDVITSANGQPVGSYEDLENVVLAVQPDQMIKLNILRGGEEKQLGCRVIAHPRGPGR